MHYQSILGLIVIVELMCTLRTVITLHKLHKRIVPHYYPSGNSWVNEQGLIVRSRCQAQLLGHKVVGSSTNNLVESAAGKASMPGCTIQYCSRAHAQARETLCRCWQCNTDKYGVGSLVGTSMKLF